MKNKTIPTSIEQKLPDDAFIVSKSDLQGNVTYCNRTLMEVSGFSEPELLGKQHNILRHPDMPRAIFDLLWSEIKAGRECFAFVKNMCKNGDYYWVFANVTPDLDDNHKTMGYFSVRRTPGNAAIRTMSELYSKMLAAEQKSATADAITAGREVLNNYLSEGNYDYETFVLSLQN